MRSPSLLALLSFWITKPDFRHSFLRAGQKSGGERRERIRRDHGALGGAVHEIELASLSYVGRRESPARKRENSSVPRDSQTNDDVLGGGGLDERRIVIAAQDHLNSSTVFRAAGQSASGSKAASASESDTGDHRRSRASETASDLRRRGVRASALIFAGEDPFVLWRDRPVGLD